MGQLPASNIYPLGTPTAASTDSYGYRTALPEAASRGGSISLQAAEYRPGKAKIHKSQAQCATVSHSAPMPLANVVPLLL